MVNAASRPRMTAQNAPRGQPGTAHRAVRLHGLECVGRARRVIATYLPVQRADGDPVRAQQRHEEGLHQAPARRSAASRSASRATAGASPAGGSARTTTRHPAGSRSMRDRIRWRSRRFTRLRTTADPTPRLTTNPTSGSLARFASGSRCTTRCIRPALEPWRTVIEKSSLLRMRWTAVNKDDSSGQLRASLAPAVAQNGAAGTGPHAQTEAVLAGTTTVVGLVRTLAHEWFLTQGVESSQTLAPVSRISAVKRRCLGRGTDSRRPPLVHRSTPCEHAAVVARTDVPTVRAGW